MRDYVRLLLIALIAPAVTCGLMMLIGPSARFLATLGYPIMVATTLLLLVPIHVMIRRWSVGTALQLILVLPAGTLGGAIVYLLLDLLVLTGSTGFISELLGQYAAIGLVTSLVAWCFYVAGPLRMSSRPSEPPRAG